MIRKPLLLAIRFYQAAVSPHLGRWCRFVPSCSEYARQAIEAHGAVRGTWLAVRRVARCHPFCAGGHDPVPTAKMSGFTRRLPRARRSVPLLWKSGLEGRASSRPCEAE